MRRWLLLQVCVIGAALAAASAPPGASALGDSAVADDVFYQIMPIAYRDSDNDPYRYGDIRGMTESLPYLAELGVTAVWTTPLFPTPAYHGYQHGPADAINPMLGHERDFLEFIREAHARGIKVFIDLVVYGINCDTEYFRGARDNPDGPYGGWIAFLDETRREYQGYTFTTWTGEKVCIAFWDLRKQGPRDLVTSWSRRWLDPNGDGDPSDGVDGFRLDHVWSRYPHAAKLDGCGYHIDAFWKPWKAALHAVNPKTFTFAEQAKWETFGDDLLPAHDAAFTKPFQFAARDAILKSAATGLDSTLRATIDALPKDLPDRTFMAVLGDHDVDRIASSVDASGQGGFGPSKVAAAVLLLQPFTPVIYAGDEIGMLGKAGSFNSDANDIPRREPFKWTSRAAAPMSNYWIRHSGAVERRYSRDGDGRSVEEQAGVEGSLLETYRALIALRRGSDALRRGDYRPIPGAGSSVWSFIREYNGEQVLVAINLSAEPCTGAFEIGDRTSARDLWRAEGAFQMANGVLTCPISAHGWRVIALSGTGP